LNPTTNFSRSAELISDTGEDNLKRFFGELTFYWHQYVHYLDEKNAFGLRYFYPYTEELTREEKELIENINRDYDGDPWKPYGGKYAQRAQSHNPEFHNLDLSDLPEFSFKEPAIATKIGMTLPNILILFVYNLLFLTLSHFSFTIYDPRRQ
jgi:ABC-type transport system involved in multi-copper enzyme maturation permease subunit